MHIYIQILTLPTEEIKCHANFLFRVLVSSYPKAEQYLSHSIHRLLKSMQGTKPRTCMGYDKHTKSFFSTHKYANFNRKSIDSRPGGEEHEADKIQKRNSAGNY